MNKSIYRNFYYVKESILEFFQCNKKCFILSILAITIGIALGLCVGINNTPNFTLINIIDKTIVVIFTDGNFFGFFISNILKYLFLMFLILIINNFYYIRFLSYLIFGYLSFILTVDTIIIISLFALKGALFCALGYVLINLALIVMLVFVSIMCRLSCDSNGNSSKFCCYPYKNIALVGVIAIGLILVLAIISKIFSNVIIIV